MKENFIEGRNAILEALRADKTIDKLYIQEALNDASIQTILREAKKRNLYINFVKKEILDKMSIEKKHQGVMAMLAAYDYSSLEEVLNFAKEKNEDPFLLVLDGIEDPHNLGAIIRTANLSGVHGVIIPKHRAVGLTATVAKTSAGAINYTKVVKVTNISNTIKELKKEGIWFVCAEMQATPMYELNLKGPIAIVVGNEGSGVSRLVKDNCDFKASIPMKGNIDSLNVSVATGILAYEVLRQRTYL